MGSRGVKDRTKVRGWEDFLRLVEESFEREDQEFTLVEELSKQGNLFTTGRYEDGSGNEVVLRYVDYLKAEVSEDPLTQQRNIDKFQEAKKLLKRQVNVLPDLDHPNLAKVLGCHVTNQGEYVIKREYVPGRSLEEAIEKGARYSEDSVKEAILQIASGMKELHTKAIHRDLKPSNVIVKDDGTYVVTDFDVLSDGIDSTGGSTCVLEQYSSGFMPPEGLDGLAISQIDVYSLGVTAARMLTGEDVSIGSEMNKRVGGLPSIGSNFRDYCKEPITDSFTGVLRKMVHPDFEKRYKNMDEVIAALTPKPEKVDDAQEKHTGAQEARHALPKQLQPVNKGQPNDFGDLISLAVILAFGFAVTAAIKYEEPVKDKRYYRHEGAVSWKPFGEDGWSVQNIIGEIDYPFDGVDNCRFTFRQKTWQEDDFPQVMDQGCDGIIDWIRSCDDFEAENCDAFYQLQDEVAQTGVAVYQDPISGVEWEGSLAELEDELARFYKDQNIKKDLIDWKKRNLEGGVLSETTLTDNGFSASCYGKLESVGYNAAKNECVASVQDAHILKLPAKSFSYFLTDVGCDRTVDKIERRAFRGEPVPIDRSSKLHEDLYEEANRMMSTCLRNSEFDDKKIAYHKIFADNTK